MDDLFRVFLICAGGQSRPPLHIINYIVFVGVDDPVDPLAKRNTITIIQIPIYSTTGPAINSPVP